MAIVNIAGAGLWVGDFGSGPPILLLHGFPLDHTMWSGQIDALCVTHRVIVPDLRGFGQSAVTRVTMTMERFADDLIYILNALSVNEPVTLCGLSMGGYVAFEFWRNNPGKVRSLVLCDTRAQPDTPEAARGRLELAERVLGEGTCAVAEAVLPRMFAPRTFEREPQVVEAMRNVILKTNPQGIAATLRGLSERRDSRPLLAAINVPVLVLVGSEDVISPPGEMLEMAAAIPGARFVEIPEAGHMAPLESPHTVNHELLTFLESFRATPL